MARPAEDIWAEVLTAQMRTDELRELLERFPDLGPAEVGRLRELYRAASATEIMAIQSTPELAAKARRDRPPTDVNWDRMLVILSICVAITVALYLLIQPSLRLPLISP